MSLVVRDGYLYQNGTASDLVTGLAGLAEEARHRCRMAMARLLMEKATRILDSTRLRSAGLLPTADSGDDSAAPLLAAMTLAETERAKNLEQGIRSPFHDWEFRPILYPLKTGDVLLRAGASERDDVYVPLIETIPGLREFWADDRTDDGIRRFGEAEWQRRIDLWYATDRWDNLLSSIPLTVPLVAEDGVLPDFDMLMQSTPAMDDRVAVLVDRIDSHRFFAGRMPDTAGQYVMMNEMRRDNQKTEAGQAALARIRDEVMAALPAGYTPEEYLGTASLAQTMAEIERLRDERQHRIRGRLQGGTAWRLDSLAQLWAVLPELKRQVAETIAIDRARRYAKQAALEIDLRILTEAAKTPADLADMARQTLQAMKLSDRDSPMNRAFQRYCNEIKSRQEMYKAWLDVVRTDQGLALNLLTDRHDLFAQLIDEAGLVRLPAPPETTAICLLNVDLGEPLYQRTMPTPEETFACRPNHQERQLAVLEALRARGGAAAQIAGAVRELLPFDQTLDSYTDKRRPAQTADGPAPTS